MAKVAALIVAAGRGQRFGGVVPKQYRMLGDMPILRRTIEAFLRHRAIDDLRVVISELDLDRYLEATAGLELAPPVIGGSTRQDSVLAGLEALEPGAPDLVLIHDGVRPLVPDETIAAVVDALGEHEAAIPAIAVIDALKSAPDRRVSRTVERRDMWRAQTPQGFRFPVILAAHRAAQHRDPQRLVAADDAVVAEEAGIAVRIVDGHEDNLKITTETDLARAERLLTAGRLEPRLGMGFDVNAFGPGDHLPLCGVNVPHEFGVVRRDNRDVPLNALTDALFGAVGQADDAAHFEPDSPRWHGGTSEQYLGHAVALASARRARIVNANVTIICERPALAPFRARMRERLAAMLSVTADRVSVIATPAAAIGFAGRREGLAAQALVTLEVPKL